MKQKELNLIDLLGGKDGIELWSPMFGKCKFDHYYEWGKYNFLIKVTTKSASGGCKDFIFRRDGSLNDVYGECMLFPSEQAYRSGRGWQDFGKPKNLTIANAKDYEPMRHWVRGIEGISDEKKALLSDLIGDTFSFNSVDKAYYLSPVNGACGFSCVSEIKDGIMTEFPPEFVEVEEEWQPEDLELVYAWGNNCEVSKVLGFYDAKNKCLCYIDGRRDGFGYQNYAPCCDPSLQEWAEEVRRRIEKSETEQ